MAIKKKKRSIPKAAGLASKARRRQTPPPVPSKLRGRPALDTSMLLAPMGAGAAIKAAASLRPSLSRTKRAAAALGGGLVGGLAGSKAAKAAAKAVKKSSANLGKRASTGLRGRSAARKKKPRKRVY